MSWMVLGPTKWRSDIDPDGLEAELLEPYLEGWWKPRGHDRPWPIDVRAAAKAILEDAGADAVLMEEVQSEPDESNTDLFHRIRQTEPVDRFLVYWPYGAQRAGLDWELGILVSEISQQRVGADAVVLLIQETAASIHTRTGQLESHEEGRRTTYYNDLVAHGCPFALWREHRGFFDAVRAWAAV